MRVAAEVAEHALGSGEGGLGVDDPVVLAKRVEESGERVVGPELAPLETLSQSVEELAAEDLRERAHGEEEARVSRRDPARAIGGPRRRRSPRSVGGDGARGSGSRCAGWP